ncbi:hypothetical protein GUITHDRAFT_138278 [Guillardia theta CCMP2712]|uniref:Uncharacterized protein n=1 Tax=Guillardia theta (strain CCMP2712) TaxID=905079 RepID=L1JE13_GUITC|nr:hypothetical protein GUITHDRAFT_138278 [Guillardia theta CCMP2712]EKX46557.1 hypothetical protein GUITHDRAFT_138278 [Guillardia theta CCMP2712]|eukprot:XP_005833537.1 hypothetical protein GUITHDRAFT_138278 [Guillardia theta CCMP2712]
MAAEGVEMLALIDSNSEATDTYEHYSKRGPDEHYDMLFVDASTPRSEQSSKRLSSRKVVKQKEPGWPYMTKMTDLIRPSTATPSSRVMGRPQSSRSVSSNISNVSSIYSTSSSEPRRLLQAKISRKQAEEDYHTLQNRIRRLQIEAQRASHNMIETKHRAEEIVKLKAQNEMRAREKELQRIQEEQQLERERQQKLLFRAQRKASIQSARQDLVMSKRRMVQQFRKEKQTIAQEVLVVPLAWRARLAEEERAAKLKYETYAREKLAMHMRYRLKQQNQIRTSNSYLNRVAYEDQLCAERKKEIAKLELEEKQLLMKLEAIQDKQRNAYAELEVALEV